MNFQPGGRARNFSISGHHSPTWLAWSGAKKSGASLKSSPAQMYQPQVSPSRGYRCPCMGLSPSLTVNEMPTFSSSPGGSNGARHLSHNRRCSLCFGSELPREERRRASVRATTSLSRSIYRAPIRIEGRASLAVKTKVHHEEHEGHEVIPKSRAVIVWIRIWTFAFVPFGERIGSRPLVLCVLGVLMVKISVKMTRRRLRQSSRRLRLSTGPRRMRRSRRGLRGRSRTGRRRGRGCGR